MNINKVTAPLIAIAIALAMFFVSWFSFDVGLSQMLFSEPMGSFAESLNDSVGAWNEYASKFELNIAVYPMVSEEEEDPDAVPVEEEVPVVGEEEPALEE